MTMDQLLNLFTFFAKRVCKQSAVRAEAITVKLEKLEQEQDKVLEEHRKASNFIKNLEAMTNDPK